MNTFINCATGTDVTLDDAKKKAYDALKKNLWAGHANSVNGIRMMMGQVLLGVTINEYVGSNV